MAGVSNATFAPVVTAVNSEEPCQDFGEVALMVLLNHPKLPTTMRFRWCELCASPLPLVLPTSCCSRLLRGVGKDGHCPLTFPLHWTLLHAISGD